MGWLGRSIGSFGNDAGKAYETAQDWRAKDQEMKAAKVREQLQMLMIPLQIQEIQQRIKQGNQAKSVGTIGTRGGGTSGLSFDPNTGAFKTQELEAGADPNDVIPRIESMKRGAAKEFQAPIQSHIDAITAGADPMKELAAAQKDLETAAIKAVPGGSTINRLQAKYTEQLSGGDVQGAQDTLKQIQEIQKATKQQSPTMWSTIAGVQQGDPDAIARYKVYMDSQKELVKERGLAFGQGRLFGLQNAWVDGVPGVMTGFEVLQAKREGKDVTIGGPLNAQTRIAYQQLYQEAGPALAAVESHIKAFDNGTDRAIFAKVLQHAGQPNAGEEGMWFRNVFSQVLKSDGLSQDGRMLTADLARLGETMGRFRGVAGLQATDSAMALTMALLPGATTPDSEMAKYQLSSLRSMITQAGGIPAMRNQGFGDLGGGTGGAGGGTPKAVPPPPPGFTLLSPGQ
jgi:hypothetical protein